MRSNTMSSSLCFLIGQSPSSPSLTSPSWSSSSSSPSPPLTSPSSSSSLSLTSSSLPSLLSSFYQNNIRHTTHTRACAHTHTHTFSLPLSLSLSLSGSKCPPIGWHLFLNFPSYSNLKSTNTLQCYVDLSSFSKLF